VVAHVVDENDRALSDVAVRLEGAESRVAVSDDRGELAFDDLPPGDYEVVGELAEHLVARASVSIEDGALVETTLTMTPAGTLRGEVVDGLGDPVPDAEVRFENSDVRAETDAFGRFTVALPTGFTRAIARHPSAGSATSARIRILRGETTEVRLVTDGRLAREDTSGSTSARFVTGVAVRVAVVDGAVRVVERLDASARTLRVGDVITSIDGESVFAAAQADALLRGPADVPALIVVRRGANERSVRVSRARHLRE
jgi:hypothetical protein